MIARTRTKGRQTPDHDFRGEFQHADYRTLCRRESEGHGCAHGRLPAPEHARQLVRPLPGVLP
jgi:hypothetical protein